MGEVAGLRQAWKAPGESMNAEPATFEGFFEDQKERLLRILSVITGQPDRGGGPGPGGIHPCVRAVAAMEDRAPGTVTGVTSVGLFVVGVDPLPLAWQ